MRFGGRLLFALLAIGCWTAAQAQERAGIALSGTIVKPVTLSAEVLAKYPPIEMDVRFMTSKGMESAHYKGVSLWAILQAQGLKDLPGHHEELKHSFTVKGRDGYVIVFSLGEIAPDFGNEQIIITAEGDGEPLPVEDGFRLIVQGDVRGARSVKDVATIEVK